MAYAETWIRTEAPLADVVALATDVERLSGWLVPVRGVPLGDGDLGRVGAQVTVVWALGDTTTATLRTVHRVRDVLHLELSAPEGPLGALCLSLSSWDGGTAIELSADVDGASRVALGWTLRRSAQRLAALAARAPVAAASTRGRSAALRVRDVGAPARP